MKTDTAATVTHTEMYEALRDMVAMYHGLDDMLGATVKAKLARARAALATAEGRTS